MAKQVRFVAFAVAALFAGSALAAAPASTPELVAKGKASYDINCASCHGAKGLGDGVAAAALAKKPRNLIKGTFEKGTKPDQIFATLGTGIPGTPMIGYAHLSEEERWALTYYVLELRGAKKAAQK